MHGVDWLACGHRLLLANELKGIPTDAARQAGRQGLLLPPQQRLQRNKGRRIVLIGSLEPQPTRRSAPSMRGQALTTDLIDPPAPELGLMEVASAWLAG